MKKMVILFNLLLVFGAITAYASQNSISSTRSELGKELNSATRKLKVGMSITDKTLKEDEKEFRNLKEKVKDFYENSKDPESNPTLRKQGKGVLTPCKYSQKDLVWRKGKWQCVKPTYGVDCQINEYEDRVPLTGTGQRGSICKPKIKYYTYEPTGWGVCNPKTGEQIFHTSCMFHNTRGIPVYDVSSEYCKGAKPDVPKPNACWGTWKEGKWGSCQVADINTCSMTVCEKIKSLRDSRDYYQTLRGNYYLNKMRTAGLNSVMPMLNSYNNKECLCSFDIKDISKLTGIQTREVLCDSEYCNPSEVHETEQDCNFKFDNWVTGSWSGTKKDTSGYGGNFHSGFGGKICMYRTRGVTCPGFCDVYNKPATRINTKCWSMPNGYNRES